MAEENHQPEIVMVDEEEEEWEDDEVFYEKIEAPKFVDFTSPNHYRPDDRYWFCLRVGCDQKHEEEMDSEKIYKDFVLRVMAARSPNVRLQKALSRRAAGKNLKCPLTAPPKCSKSRLSRLAVASTIARKLIVDKEKVTSQSSKPTSTPRIKGKQVAAKYLTTPRNKKCLPNPNSFRSVQNPKPTALDVPRNRTVAKALVFHSPKKAISLKKSVELRTPLTKLCQGMKKLEITDQKKRVLGYSAKSKDIKGNNAGDPPLRNRISQKDKTKVLKSTGKSQTRVVRETRPVRSTKFQNQAKLGKQCHENQCSKLEVDLTSGDGAKELVTALHSHKDSPQSEGANVCAALLSTKNLDLASLEAMTDESNCDADERGMEKNIPQSQLPSEEDHDGSTNCTEGNLVAKPNNADRPIRFQTSEEAGHHDNDIVDNDDKENVSVPDENRGHTNYTNQAEQKVLGVQKMQKLVKKNTQPVAKILKEDLLTTNAGGASVKSKKPKPTNPKPFRLRTDERGILREADLQRKKHASDNENRCIQDNPEGDERALKGSQNDLTKEKGIKSHRSLEGKVRLMKSSITPEKGNAKTPIASCLRKGQKLTVIQEASTDVSKPNKAGKLHKNGAAALIRAKASITPSRRPLTIPKEPHFHSTHRPKSCTRNLAELVPL